MITTTLMVSAVTPAYVLPPLAPAKAGMQGGEVNVMFSCSKPPGAHLPLSPVSGRPRASTCCAWDDAPAPVDFAVAAGPVPAPAPGPLDPPADLAAPADAATEPAGPPDP